MDHDDQGYGYYVKERPIFKFIVIGILIFIFVYFPFFATNLRYMVGSSLSLIFDAIGSLCLVVGGLFFTIGIMQLFTRGYNWVGNILLGVILLYIGCWLTGAVLNLMGFEFGNSDSSSGGYH
jgi:hypothetical protein